MQNCISVSAKLKSNFRSLTSFGMTRSKDLLNLQIYSYLSASAGKIRAADHDG
jgi:hypothetical protein